MTLLVCDEVPAYLKIFNILFKKSKDYSLTRKKWIVEMTIRTIVIKT